MGVQIVKLLGSAVDVNVNVNPAGAYDGGTTYNTGDVVEYNGSSYIAKQGTTGNLPTDTTYWQLLAEKGDTGATGDTGADGLGWTGGSYDGGTGVVTFTSDDALGFSTGDLRGADGADGLGVPAGGTTGQILSKVSNADNDTTWSDAPSGTLDGLTDTTLTSPADGEVLQYDSGTSKWVNATASGGGGGPSLYTIVVDAAGGGDYTTITAALAAASAGDTIYIKAGTYNESFTSSLNDIALIGESNVNTEIVLTSTNLTLSGSRLDVRNLKFTTGTSYQFNFSASYSSMRNCVVSGNRSPVMYCGGLYSNFSDNYFESTGTSGRFYWESRNRVNNNRFVVPHNSLGGIYLKKECTFADNFIYRQNNSTSSGNPLLYSAGGSASAPGSTISGNIFYSGIGTTIILGLHDVCSNNSLVNSGKYGIQVNDACTVTGNIVHNANSAGYCIHVTGANRSLVSGNKLYDASGNGYGIYVENTDKVNITANVIEACGVTGITIVSGCTDVLISSNIFDTCATDISDAGTSTVSVNNIAS